MRPNGSAQQLEQRRRKAVALLEEGLTTYEVATRLGCTALRGKWLILTHGRVTARFGKPVTPGEQGTSGLYGTVTGAYEIDRVEKRDGRTWIHLARDHGLRMAGNTATEVFSMWRTYEGPERFVIPLHAPQRREP